MKKKQRMISSSTKITTTTTTKKFRDHPTTTKSEFEEQAKDKVAKEQLTDSAKGPRKVSIPGHEQYSEDRYDGSHIYGKPRFGKHV